MWTKVYLLKSELGSWCGKVLLVCYVKDAWLDDLKADITTEQRGHNVVRLRMWKNGESLSKQDKGGRNRNVELIFCRIREERARKKSSDPCQRAWKVDGTQTELVRDSPQKLAAISGLAINMNNWWTKFYKPNHD